MKSIAIYVYDRETMSDTIVILRLMAGEITL